MDSNQKDRVFWTAYFILVGLFLLRLLPFALKDSRMWGFNHLIFLPPIYSIIYIVLGLIALLIPLFFFGQSWGEKFIDWFSKVFFELPGKYLFRLIFIACAGVVFILFPMPTHFLGDGYALIADLASKDGAFVKWSEKGATFVMQAIQSLLGSKNETTAITAFRIVSAIAGVVSIWFFFLISGILSDNRLKRCLIFAAFTLTGSLLLFFGYVENYPILWISLTGFIYFNLAYLKSGRKLWVAVLFLIGGFFVHLQMAVFLPSLIYPIFSRGFGKLFYKRFKILIWILAGIIAGAGIILFQKEYSSNPYFENIFLPLYAGKPIDPLYFLLSLSHLLDCINQLILLSPLIILFIILSAKNSLKFWQKSESLFLAIVSLGGLSFLFSIDPILTMPRDWDLFSLTGSSLAPLAILLLPQKAERGLRSLMIPVIALMVISPFPYILTNLNGQNSIKYTKYIANLDRPKSMTTMLLLRDHYKREGDQSSSDSVNKEINSSYGNFRNIWRVLSALDSDDWESVNSLMPTIVPNKYSMDYHRMLATYYFKKGQNRRALDEAGLTMQLRNYNPETFAFLAQIYGKLKMNDSALQTLKIGYHYRRTSKYILDGLASMYLLNHQLDSALKYAHELVSADSTEYIGYYYLAGIYSLLGKPAPAKSNAEQYIKLGQSDPKFQTRISELQRMVPSQ